METVLITGGAGFIGYHLCKNLLASGYRVICVDNFLLGSRQNMAEFTDNACFRLCELDACESDRLAALLDGEHVSTVFHLAANSDIQKSAADPRVDLDNTLGSTIGLLEAMRRTNTKKLFFASTSAVYGDKADNAVNENVGGLRPISYYGGAKLASEAMISSYAYMNDMAVLVFRFPNVIGPKLTHGVIFDFVKKLKKDPKSLEILGDGTQSKPYLYVEDLVGAICEFVCKVEPGVSIYNIGVETQTTVREIADMVCQQMGLSDVVYHFTGGNRGWKGDVNSFQYDLSKIKAAGWTPNYTSNQSVQATLDHLHLC